MKRPDDIRCVQYLVRMDERDGGVVRFLLNFCDDLARRGHKMTVLTQDDRDVPEAWRNADANPRVVTVPLPTRLLANLPEESQSVVEALFAEVDLVHMHRIWDPANIPLARLCEQIGVPYLVSAHGMLNDWALSSKRYKKWVYLSLTGRRFLADAARIHCASEGEREQAARNLPRDNTAVVPLSFDRENFESLPGPELARQKWALLTEGIPTVLMLGRLDPVKRVELLIDAIAELHGDRLPVQLIIAGPLEQPHYVDKLQRVVASHGLQPHVHFLGTVMGADKASLYQACDVFALSSWQECFGMVLAEALSAETPVVTTRSVDTWRDFEAAGAKIVDDTPTALAAGIRELLDRPEVRQDLGRRGRQYVFQWLEPEKVLAEWEAFYREVVGS